MTAPKTYFLEQRHFTVLLEKDLNEKVSYQIRSFKRIWFLVIGIYSFFIILQYVFEKCTAVIIIPAIANTRSNPLRKYEL
jgi:hypothetical protein